MRINNKDISGDTSDKQLVGLIVDGYEPALNELMSRYKHKLFAFIFRYVKDEDAAYDILQETFIRLHFKAETYSPAYKFSTWLYQIAINLCRDWGRKKKVRLFLSLDIFIGDNDGGNTYHDIIADSASDVEDLADIRQQLRIIDQEIEKLPHKLKTALILFAIEGNSQEICAELLNTTTKTVETRVYRARKILTKKLVKNF